MKIAILISTRLRFCKSDQKTGKPTGAYSRYWGPTQPTKNDNVLPQ